MKTSSIALGAALAIALSLPAPQGAHASFSPVQRCRASDGTTMYTDKPCAAFHAAPEAISTDLNMRLATADAQADSSITTAPELSDDASIPAAQGTPVGRRSLLSGCAKSPTQLAMDIQGSMALHDVNRLAESWYWVGTSQREATPRMKRLERMAHQSLQATNYYDAQMGYGLQLASATDAGADNGRAGIMQVSLAGEGGPGSLDLNVERYAGCYFVRF